MKLPDGSRSRSSFSLVGQFCQIVYNSRWNAVLSYAVYTILELSHGLARHGSKSSFSDSSQHEVHFFRVWNSHQVSSSNRT